MGGKRKTLAVGSPGLKSTDFTNIPVPATKTIVPRAMGNRLDRSDGMIRPFADAER